MPADARNVQIDPAVQADLRDFARRLPGMDLYGVLGVDRGADEDGIREAFFDRSRAYHPDRYFGKDVGVYGELVTEIFKRVTTAYEVLRDPELRRSYDRSRPASRAPKPEAPATAPASAAKPGAPVSGPGPTAPAPTEPPRSAPAGTGRPATPRRPSRMALQRLQRQLGLTRTKARRHFDEALELQRAGDLERAHAILRLALIFDPHEPTYQDVFGEISMSLGQGRSAAPSAAPGRFGGEGT